MIPLFIAAATKTKTEPQGWWSDPAFGLNRVEVLHIQVAGRPLWQYAATVLWFVMAFVVAQIVDYVVTRWVKRITAKTETDLDDKLLEILHRPLKILVVLLMLKAGLQVFDWPGLLEKVLHILFAAGMAVTGIYVGMRLLDLLLDATKERLFTGDERLAKMILPLISRTLKAFVLITGALTTVQYLGVPITSALAGLGVGGIAVALAAQSTLANVFGSITILTDRPFRVGDRIQIDKYDGEVEQIGLRSTRIRTLEGHLVVIPNKMVADSAINNISLRPNIRETFSLSLTYDTTADRVQEAVTILKGIFAAHPMTHDVIVFWKTYAAASLDIFVVYWCKTKDYREFTQALEEINLEIKRRFDAAGLEFAFPTQTIHLHQENA